MMGPWYIHIYNMVQCTLFSEITVLQQYLLTCFSSSITVLIGWML